MCDEIVKMELAARSPNGVEWITIDSKGENHVKILSEPTEKTISGVPYHGIRCMQFSDDGELFAFSDRNGTTIIKCDTEEVIHRLPLEKTAAIRFSPYNRYFCTWEPYAVYGKNPEKKLPDPNCRTWSMESGELLSAVIEKRQDSWTPQFSSDESICLRVNGSELLFLDENQQYFGKHVINGVKTVALSKGSPPFHVATYLHANKGQPGTIRLVLVDFKTFPTVANKSSFKADTVRFSWNSKGTVVLCTTEADVDASNQSYYGEQQLYLMSVSGEGIKLNLDKRGPVYGIDWHPNGLEFCAVYGYMPARATVFNLKGEVIHDMGEGPRNECMYNPIGNMLLISGFGNLPGQMEFWTTEHNVKKAQRLICKMKVANTTMCFWAPDSQHVITATTAPRLRIDNGWRIWHYTGSCLKEQMCIDKEEMHEVKWRPQPALIERTFDPVFLSLQQRNSAGLDAKGKVQSATDLKPLNSGDMMNNDEHPAEKLTLGGVYVPPHLKGKLIQPSHDFSSELNKERTKTQPKVENSANQKKILKLTKQIQKAEEAKKKLESGKPIESNQLSVIEKLDDMRAQLETLKTAA